MKPQALSLIRHLNSGGEVTRDSAWADFNIQNLTARISELTARGYDIIKNVIKAKGDGRIVRLTTWKFRHTINVGDYVQVTADVGTYVSLRGRIGKVDKISLEHGIATVFIDGVGFRSLRFNALKRISILPTGTAVSLRETKLIIGGYNKESDSYMLLTPADKASIVAHSSLVLPDAAQQATAHAFA